ncbi:Diphthine--ammonia ligase [Neolecta irregularis DAH-3]|uniref:Diphthine--ammonia ligase n=1 Tax=Neolecta irregularis (strain DAH-3) TaxID=1198029 RepID=A0A1U7LMC3_NEOID|nr:Diphthine--ammonia ligase [Neolecta irregularis DAH-3]|eukprot:OLL23733.1 Diphthine--ammonia ligase [Neolecta irregularis DAH-3]
MKLVALVSGGKDSCFNMMECVKNGHTIDALANLYPPASDADEMDSFMYQTVGHNITELIADAMGIPLYRREITGASLDQNLNYSVTEKDETEDLYLLLQEVMMHRPEIEGVSVGAILSNYQRTRVENVCSRLGLLCYGFLWQRAQNELLKNMIACSLDAILIKVAALGLNERHLGKSLTEMHDYLMELENRYGLNTCGEGGEYETIVLDCPIFKKRIVLDSSETIKHDLGGVYYLKLKAHTEAKGYSPQSAWNAYIQPKHVLDEDMFFHDIYGRAALVKDRNENLEHLNGNSSFSNLSFSYMELNGYVFIANVTSLSPVLEDAMIEIHKQIDEFLNMHGQNFNSILHTTIVLQNMHLFANVNSYYSKWFSEPLPPSRACIATCSLPTQVSVSVITKAKTTAKKCGLHVQSRSYWAPSNIGPYSQLRRTNEIIFIAGQIGLVPSTMDFPEDIRLETVLALRSFHRILEAENVSSRLIEVMICYTTNEAYRDLIRHVWTSYLPSAELIILVVDQLPRNSRVEWVSIVGTEGTKFEVVRDIRSTNPVFLFSTSECLVPDGCCFVPVQKVLDFEDGRVGISVTFREREQDSE